MNRLCDSSDFFFKAVKGNKKFYCITTLLALYFVDDGRYLLLTY
jgi:hypothetical protein